VGLTNLFDESESLALFGRAAIHTLRPERIEVLPADASDGRTATVTDLQYLGPEIRLSCTLASGAIVVAGVPSTNLQTPTLGEVVKLHWDSKAVFEVPNH